MRRLAENADVVVENFRVGGLKKFGLDSEALRAANPQLIYASITGFGQDGPYADRAGYDYIIQGMGGLMSITGLADGEPGGGPMRVGVAVVDLFTGLYTCVAILAALFRRERSGEGAHDAGRRTAQWTIAKRDKHLFLAFVPRCLLLLPLPALHRLGEGRCEYAGGQCDHHHARDRNDAGQETAERRYRIGVAISDRR